MNSEISKKVIFTSLLFINCIQPIKSSNLKIYNNRNIPSSQFNTSKLVKNKTSYNSSNLFFKNKFGNTSKENKILDKNLEISLTYSNEKIKELVVESDIQFEENDVIYAEGNASVLYGGKLLRADKIIFDKSTKKITAEGNITLVFGEQLFKMSKLEYNLKDKTGVLLDVKGSINSERLITDISKNFYESDIQKLDNLLNSKKKEVLNTPDKVHNWIFSTERISIDEKKWKSEKAIFSNDILQFKQVKIEINLLEVYSSNEEIRFRSSLNYLVLDENVSIPFWLGNRALTKSEPNFDSKSSLTFGYDKLDKDGLFIGRKLNSINLDDNFIFDLEPQFLIQRSLYGQTKSFVKKGDLITGEKVKRDAKFSDYFGIKSQIKGEINNWDLEIENNLNSLDIDKLSDAFRSKTYLTREINFLNSKWDKSFYGIYRDRVWNGSLGEAEIYLGYGSELKKENTWVVDGIKKTELLFLSLAKIKAEALDTKNLTTKLKGNLFYSLDQKFPISTIDPIKKSIDTSYRYIPKPITKGLSLDTRLEASYSFYENGNHQEHLGLGMGPELIFGNFQNKNFDYTRLSLFPFYKFSNGDSVFKFDQNSDKLTLNIVLDQQLFGPVLLKTNGTLNLTNNSDDYGEFIDSKISLNWKKRSYEFGIFYQPHNQAGGISFSLFGFK